VMGRTWPAARGPRLKVPAGNRVADRRRGGR
jgi:hypothetical protein